MRDSTPTDGFTVTGMPATALVLASPHSGRAYPPAFLAQTRLRVDQLRRAEDAFVDTLVGAAPDRGVPLVAAHYGRAWLDLNRSADELDPSMFDTAPAPHPDQHGDRVRVGLGILPRIAAHGLDIYTGPLSLAHARARISAVHTPYHATLAQLLDAAHVRHGHAVLIDCSTIDVETARHVALGNAQEVDVQVDLDRAQKLADKARAAAVTALAAVMPGTPTDPVALALPVTPKAPAAAAEASRASRLSPPPSADRGSAHRLSPQWL